ncbi:MAG: glycerate kinase [Gammaproteobacteria bacterium]
MLREDAATVPPMKILLAPDSFKESLPAAAVATALARGLADTLPEAHCEQLPVADGGEGTLAVLAGATKGRTFSRRVRGPDGAAIDARYAITGDGHTAVVEMAEASGLDRVPAGARDARTATSYGTGELIDAALGHGVRQLIVTLGGSATNDGGAGMCQALGLRLLDAAGDAITSAVGGADLARVSAIDTSGLDPRLRELTVRVACDVDHPLLGPRGASAVFGPQKGADKQAVAELDAALDHYFSLVEAHVGRTVRDAPGAGAAGGAGAGLMALLGAELASGAELVLETLDFEQRLHGVDLVITGEGRIDAQTGAGKAPQAVARLAARRGVPVIAVAGDIVSSADGDVTAAFDAVEPCIAGPTSLAAAIAGAEHNLVAAGRRIGRWLRLAGRLPAPP